MNDVDSSYNRSLIYFNVYYHRNAVGDLNNKYKHCLIMCKQLSTQEELLSHDEMKGVTLTADKLLYLHAIDLCLNAASLEFFGKAQEVS
jgi:serine/threonine-protein kinase ULK2